jgi:hypothetical protein
MKRVLYLSVLLSGLLFFSKAEAAQLFFRTDKTSYRVDQSGFVTLNINTEKKIVNAISGVITFNPANVEISKVSTDKSIVNFWVQSAAIDNSRGTVAFKGVVLNPAYNGTLGRILGLDFKAIAPGKPQFGIIDFSVLANDGKGTSLATKGQAAAITISGTAVSRSGVSIASASHPNQQKWYNKTNVSISWKALEKDITVFAYGFNKDSKTEVPAAGATNSTSTVQRSVASGVWYAHVRAQHKTKGWLSTEHFKISIDNEPPPEITITVLPRLNESILPTIRAVSRDALSGTASYEVLVNGKLLNSFKTITALKLSKLNVGKNTVEVKAFDNAGNIRSNKISLLYNPLPVKKSNPTVPATPSKPTTPTKPSVPKINTPILFD